MFVDSQYAIWYICDMALKGRRSTPEEKLRAVQLLKAGNNAATIAQMFGVSRAILFRWQQKYDEGGPSALEIKKAPGPASRLNSEQLSRLHSLIAGNDPRQLQLDFGLWTRKLIRDLIRSSAPHLPGRAGRSAVPRVVVAGRARRP